MERPNDPPPSRPGRRAPDRELAWPGDEEVRAAAGLLTGPDDLARALARWAADATVDDAARRRARERWLRVQAEEEVSLVGVLADLAESGRAMVLDAGGQRVTGVAVGLGADFVALAAPHGRVALVPFAALDLVRTGPGSSTRDAATGDRPDLPGSFLDVGLAAVLDRVAGERLPMAVWLRGGEQIRGTARGAGRDVVRLRTDGDPPASAWVPLAAIIVLVIEP